MITSSPRPWPGVTVNRMDAAVDRPPECCSRTCAARGALTATAARDRPARRRACSRIQHALQIGAAGRADAVRVDKYWQLSDRVKPPAGISGATEPTPRRRDLAALAAQQGTFAGRMAIAEARLRPRRRAATEVHRNLRIARDLSSSVPRNAFGPAAAHQPGSQHTSRFVVLSRSCRPAADAGRRRETAVSDK